MVSRLSKFPPTRKNKLEINKFVFFRKRPNQNFTESPKSMSVGRCSLADWATSRSWSLRRCCLSVLTSTSTTTMTAMTPTPKPAGDADADVDTNVDNAFHFWALRTHTHSLTFSSVESMAKPKQSRCATGLHNRCNSVRWSSLSSFWVISQNDLS